MNCVFCEHVRSLARYRVMRVPNGPCETSRVLQRACSQQQFGQLGVARAQTQRHSDAFQVAILLTAFSYRAAHLFLSHSSDSLAFHVHTFSHALAL